MNFRAMTPMADASQSEFLEQARQKLTDLQHNEHAQNQIWGASVHRFRVNPPVPEEEVARLEKEHDIELPSDYRSYLIEIGDGGAGPWQGLLPIREAIAESLMECPRCLAQPFLHGTPHIDPDGKQRKWFQFRQPDRRGYVPLPIDEAMRPEFMAGSLIIAHGRPKGGAHILYRLVLNGLERGRVWRDDRARSGTVAPSDSPSWRVHDPQFREWMLAWLDQCVIGHQFGL